MARVKRHYIEDMKTHKMQVPDIRTLKKLFDPSKQHFCYLHFKDAELFVHKMAQCYDVQPPKVVYLSKGHLKYQRGKAFYVTKSTHARDLLEYFYWYMTHKQRTLHKKDCCPQTFAEMTWAKICSKVVY